MKLHKTQPEYKKEAIDEMEAARQNSTAICKLYYLRNLCDDFSAGKLTEREFKEFTNINDYCDMQL
jgi:hypothetical protein